MLVVPTHKNHNNDIVRASNEKFCQIRTCVCQTVGILEILSYVIHAYTGY